MAVAGSGEGSILVRKVRPKAEARVQGTEIGFAGSRRARIWKEVLSMPTDTHRLGCELGSV